MNILITTDHSASSYGQPVVLVDGELVAPNVGVRAAYDAIKNIPLPDLISTSFQSPPPTLAQEHDASSLVAAVQRARAQDMEVVVVGPGVGRGGRPGQG